MEVNRPLRILLVDFLDSYSHNIPAFVRQASLHYDVEVLFHIEPYNALSKDDVAAVTERFDGVVLSPGPGTVDSADDIGDFAPALLAHRPPIPIFGVCLGFQAICKAFGATIERLNMPHHGLVCQILDKHKRPLGRCGTRYHSLQVRMTPESSKNLFTQAIVSNFDDATTYTTVEVAHRDLPFWGVQYHPESVYSTGCDIVVQPFIQAALNRTHQKVILDASLPLSSNSDAYGMLTPDSGYVSDPDTRVSGIGFEPDGFAKESMSSTHKCARLFVDCDITTSERETAQKVLWKRVNARTDCLNLLTNTKDASDDFVLLDSSTKGDWDILASASSARRVCYSIRERKMRQGSFKKPAGSEGKFQEIDASLDEMWEILEEFSKQRTFSGGPSEVPFWGGFLGYFSYELGLAKLGLEPYPSKQSYVPDFDDLQLLWSTETLLYCKATQETCLISLTQDQEWIDRISAIIEGESAFTSPLNLEPTACGHIRHPGENEYIDKICAAQEELKAGNSYEICLTALSEMYLPPSGSNNNPENPQMPQLIARFSNLRRSNPAAFMSLLKLGDVTLLSASPEEFLSFNAETRIAKMKPIKGTLSKKRLDGERVTLEEARKALSHHKTVAENLMIVDLVRNDLSKVSEQVTCPDLLWVEEIETMYQLVSTIQAVVNPGKNAWHLLKSTLPPGSMTGAPKRRSCQILQTLEQNFRGLYSGVVGYIDVRGNCRTSVSIRNAAKYPGESFWRVGAGGAITNLSDPQEEWHERQLKASSISRALTTEFEILETALWDPETSSITHADKHVERLMNSIHFFGFKDPLDQSQVKLSTRLTNLNREGSMQDYLQNKAISQLSGVQRLEPHRLSFKVSSNGDVKIDTVHIPRPDAQSAPIRVRLDPCATNAQKLEPFISYKTTKRDHYVSARDRSEVQGREEVLLFQPTKISSAHGENGVRNDPCSTRPGSPEDLLTEGTYTNVAVFDRMSSRWITPSTGCLKGIQRQILIEEGIIHTGDVKRSDLHVGVQVKLFNSVRGCFEGVIC